jgi:hypothetical protein
MSRRNAIFWGLMLVPAALIVFQVARHKQVPRPSERGISQEQHPMPKEIRVFCGDCHQPPAPDAFPKDAWYKEVQRGFDFYVASKRTDLIVPKMADVLSWYREASPQELPRIGFLPRTKSNVTFQSSPVRAPENLSPMVASLSWNEQAGRWARLRLSDMYSGDVSGILAGDRTVIPGTIAQVSNPACSKVIDLDQDGTLDLLIADLGSKEPADHALGKVTYISGAADQTTPIVLLAGVGRVADTTAADFDLDGDLDLVVAEFGWLTSGKILLMENLRGGERSGEPLTADDFQIHQVDKRHGTIHVPVTDLNGDGLPDFVALISQEHETVEAFINEGGLTFRREVILPSQDPSFGSCGIELVDVDLDGDVDVVYCNGDTLDSHLVKPYHGVHVLTNEGRYPFQHTKVLALPGASDTATADLDGDGDLDIAVSGYLPAHVLRQLPAGTFDALCWLEQTGAMQFQPHVIEVGAVGHLGLVAGDFNEDGSIDLAVGNCRGSDWGTIWWNGDR